MRSIAKYTLNVGLIAAPVKLYSATEDHGLHFNNLCPKCNSRIRLKNHCETCSVDVAYGDIVKGYEVDSDRFVTMTDADFDMAKVDKNGGLEIEHFCDLKEVDPIYFDKTYYVGPDKGGEEAFALLTAILQEEGKAAVAHFVMRSREHVAIIRATGNSMIMHTLLYLDEVRDNEEKATMSLVDPKKLALGKSLVANLSDKFDIAQYKDNYIESLRRIIEQKAAGHTPTPTKKAEVKKAEKNLLDALSASIEASKTKKKRSA